MVAQRGNDVLAEPADAGHGEVVRQRGVLALPFPTPPAPPAEDGAAGGGTAVGPGWTRVWDALTGSLVRVIGAVWSRPTLRMTTVATTLSHFADGGLTLAVALFAVQLGHSEAAGGVLLSGFALGALLGSLAMTWPPARRVPAPTMVLRSLVAIGGLLALAAAAPTFPLALVCVAAAGFFDGPTLAATLAVRGEEAPEGMRTEVFTRRPASRSPPVRWVRPWRVGSPTWEGAHSCC